MKLWFNCILGLNFFSSFLKTHNHTLPYTKREENKIWTKDKIKPLH